MIVLIPFDFLADIVELIHKKINAVESTTPKTLMIL